ncbi:6661_t:CDS:2 [Paraglomus occultum]|uniref:6661_t:CDS:1 n=1 Tax=Paraglomus occultum TaxID=144539 RepID=A0A9N9BPD8_9GLOM|nr:6661_t:CDS:2 [Paraglomus occultum]
MNIEEFRKRGYEAIDRICRYYGELDSVKVLPEVKPGYLKKLLPKHAPEEAEPWEDIQADFESTILPGVTHWQSPNFFAFYPANSSFPAIIADMFSDMINCVGFNWICSPACTELETIVLDWVSRLIGLDDGYLSDGEGGGVIQGTASEAVLVVMLAARQRVIDEYKKRGYTEEDIVTKLIAYGSDQAHSAVEKASMIVNCKFKALPSDDEFCLRGSSVRSMMEKDIEEGLIPFFITATIGTTSSAATDYIDEIACTLEGTSVWLHIDAAYAGAALICPEYQYLLKGVDRSQSFNINMHKWLLTNFDCSCLWVRKRSHLLNALSLTPAFLRNTASDSGLVIDYRDWQIPLGRRFRSLKIWFVLRAFGANGLREHIRKSVKLARRFEEELSKYPNYFAVTTKPAFSLVCFHLKPQKKTNMTSNELTAALYNGINNSRELYVTQTKLGSQTVIRFVVGSPWTAERHVVDAVKKIVDFTEAIIKDVELTIE